MASRRIVTEEIEGRSRVASDGPISPAQHWQEIWTTSSASPLGIAQSDPIASLDLSPGTTAWRLFEVPPDEEVRRLQAEAASAAEDSDLVPLDSDGFHQTHTVDFIYLLEGRLVLELDESAVDLEPGDFVVQRSTNHAWRNPTDQPAKVLGVMMGVAPA